jgi:hypothetical protein
MSTRKVNIFYGFCLWLILMLFMPFMVFPLLYIVANQFITAERQQWNGIALLWALIPAIYAYYQLIKKLIIVGISRSRGTLVPSSFKSFVKTEILITLKLLLIQFVSIVGRNFSIDSFFETIMFQIFYFSANMYVILFSRFVVKIDLSTNLLR